MPWASSWMAAVTMSSTERLWPRWTTSAPCACRIRRMMLIEASWPSNRLAAVMKRSGAMPALAARLRPTAPRGAATPVSLVSLAIRMSLATLVLLNRRSCAHSAPVCPNSRRT